MSQFTIYIYIQYPMQKKTKLFTAQKPFKRIHCLIYIYARIAETKRKKITTMSADKYR